MLTFLGVKHDIIHAREGVRAGGDGEIAINAGLDRHALDRVKLAIPPLFARIAHDGVDLMGERIEARQMADLDEEPKLQVRSSRCYRLLDEVKLVAGVGDGRDGR
jgi:hypothetical protein